MIRNNNHKLSNKRRNNKQEHPSKDITGILGSELANKKIVLCITGSVASYKSIDLARLLMRHGANVFPVISNSASNLLKPDFLKWATGNDVIFKLTGNMEHIFLADYGKSDLIIVYPCTANTLSKFANGIDDTPITSILSVAIGSNIPIFIAPAMHEAMYNNKFVTKNIKLLENEGVMFLNPIMAEGKAKILPVENTVNKIIAFFNESIKKNSISKKNVLINYGNTIEYIDPIRIIGNLSSGKTGYALISEFINNGANVTAISGNLQNSNFESLNVKLINVKTSSEMHKSVISELSSKKYDIVVLAAAISDFKPHKTSKKKIDSKLANTSLPLKLVPTTKIIDDVKKTDPNVFLVGFKAYYNVSKKYLVNKAIEKLKQSNADLIVANDVGNTNSGIGSDNNEVFIVTKKKDIIHLPLQSKTCIAKHIVSIIDDIMKK
ncbi:MAG: bifunctional phosphopantothenoylcysteine decarboxylase/phosphopantothenate--cysteine ligase CoaBC [Nitrososphaeraceae archaeon]